MGETPKIHFSSESHYVRLPVYRNAYLAITIIVCCESLGYHKKWVKSRGAVLDSLGEKR